MLGLSCKRPSFSCLDLERLLGGSIRREYFMPASPDPLLDAPCEGDLYSERPAPPFLGCDDPIYAAWLYSRLILWPEP
jgi:hypothetical protein